jgi:Holliday junction resolvase RusA-like endonuclease
VSALIDELDRIAAAATVTREEIIAAVRLSLAANAAWSPLFELHVRVIGRPIPTNRAYAPVSFTPKNAPGPIATIRLTEEGEAYRRMIHAQVLGARLRIRDWPVDAVRYEVSLRWYFFSPSADLDGPIKLALDALGTDRKSKTRAVYDDDKRVGRLIVEKYVDRANPRVEIGVRVLELRPRQEDLRL